MSGVPDDVTDHDGSIVLKLRALAFVAPGAEVGGLLWLPHSSKVDIVLCSFSTEGAIGSYSGTIQKLGGAIYIAGGALVRIMATSFIDPDGCQSGVDGPLCTVDMDFFGDGGVDITVSGTCPGGGEAEQGRALMATVMGGSASGDIFSFEGCA